MLGIPRVRSAHDQMCSLDGRNKGMAEPPVLVMKTSELWWGGDGRGVADGSN